MDVCLGASGIHDVGLERHLLVFEEGGLRSILATKHARDKGAGMVAVQVAAGEAECEQSYRGEDEDKQGEEAGKEGSTTGARRVELAEPGRLERRELLLLVHGEIIVQCGREDGWGAGMGDEMGGSGVTGVLVPGSSSGKPKASLSTFLFPPKTREERASLHPAHESATP